MGGHEGKQARALPLAPLQPGGHSFSGGPHLWLEVSRVLETMPPAAPQALESLRLSLLLQPWRTSAPPWSPLTCRLVNSLFCKLSSVTLLERPSVPGAPTDALSFLIYSRVES